MNNGENRHYGRKTGGALGKRPTSREERDAARSARDSDAPSVTPATVDWSTTERTKRVAENAILSGPERQTRRGRDDRRAFR